MDQARFPSLSVVIPVFNEEESILSTLDSLNKELNKNNITYEIIIVNDGSSDGSENILNALNNNATTVIHHSINKGYGASLKTGIKSARYPWILITDADGSYPLDSIPALLEHTSDHDMVIGSREGKKVHDSIPRKIGRNFVRWFASYISDYPIVDVNSGLRIFKKKDAERFWHLFPEGFSFTSTITVASHTSGNKIKYHPINYYKRKGKSSIKPAKDFIGWLALLTRLALYYKPLKVFVPISIFLFVSAWIVLIGSWLFLPQILDATFAILIIASIQTFFLGLMAEMIVKRFYSSDGK